MALPQPSACPDGADTPTVGVEPVGRSLPPSQDDVIATLAQFLVDDAPLADTVARVARLACQAGPADSAGVTVQGHGRARLVASTDDLAGRLDQLQVRLDEGPSLHAHRHQQPCRIADTTAETRWPRFAAEAHSSGVGSTLSLPIESRGQAAGTLNLYAAATDAFGDDVVDHMALFARQAGVVLVNAQTYWEARALNDNLQQAMASRATIDHAIGILMAGGAPTPEDAFQILVRASQRENRKLRAIAAGIVARASQRCAHPTQARTSPGPG